MMKKTVLLSILIALIVSCGERNREKKGLVADSAGDREWSADADSGNIIEQRAGSEPGEGTGLPAGAVLIASDIVTEVIISPDPEGDPWEVEKVAGYDGQTMVDGIFSRIYEGSMTVYDYHSGEPLSPADVRKIEGEFKNDRTKIGKLSFTEDWYYYPGENRIEKRARSVTFGYELYNNVGKVYAYRAAFRADLQ